MGKKKERKKGQTRKKWQLQGAILEPSHIYFQSSPFSTVSSFFPLSIAFFFPPDIPPISLTTTSLAGVVGVSTSIFFFFPFFLWLFSGLRPTSENNGHRLSTWLTVTSRIKSVQVDCIAFDSFPESFHAAVDQSAPSATVTWVWNIVMSLIIVIIHQSADSVRH